MPRGTIFLAILVLIQSFCASIFLWFLVSSLLGFGSGELDSATGEMLDLMATIGLVLGAALGAVAVTAAMKRAQSAEQALRSASGALSEVIEEHFESWGLTPAEREVAWFSIKGFSLAEIAGLRKTSQGTVKAQSNAIYRKADVAGRSQLISVFIEDLLSADRKIAG